MYAIRSYYEQLGRRLRTILRAAAKHNTLVNLDLESYAVKNVTLRVFKEIIGEDEFAAGPHTAMVIQAYLRESEEDCKALIKWAKKHKRHIV